MHRRVLAHLRTTVHVRSQTIFPSSLSVTEIGLKQGICASRPPTYCSPESILQPKNSRCQNRFLAAKTIGLRKRTANPIFAEHRYRT